MNYMKRAIQSLWAKKGRSIIMIAVFSAILIFVLAGLTIRSGADLATTNAKKSVGATVTLSTNREAMFKQSDSEDENSRPDPGSFERTPVNLSDAKKIAKLSNVKSYSFEASTSADKSSGSNRFPATVMPATIVQKIRRSHLTNRWPALAEAVLLAA